MTNSGQAKRVFCWSGGGLSGLDIHCGIWTALERNGVTADLNVGTSAGAIVAALNSAGMTPTQCRELLLSLRDEHVRRERFAWKLRVMWIDHFLSHDPIKTILKPLLPARFHDLLTPLRVGVTDDETGDAVLVGGGYGVADVLTAVSASMAIAGVFAPVSMWHNGRLHDFSDGGTTQNLPLPADLSAFDEVWLLVATPPLDYARRGNTILSRLIWNMHIMAKDQVQDTIERARREHPRVFVVRPELKRTTGMLRFDHALIGDAFAATDLAVKRMLQEGPE